MENSFEQTLSHGDKTPNKAMKIEEYINSIENASDAEEFGYIKKGLDAEKILQ